MTNSNETTAGKVKTPRPYFLNKAGRVVPSAVAMTLIAAHKPITPKGAEIHIYNPKTGLYEPGSDVLRRDIVIILGSYWRKDCPNQVLTFIADSTKRDAVSLRPPDNLLLVKNGILDVDTGTLRPFSPDYFFTSRIQAEFRPEARCQKVDKFLEEITANAKDAKTLKQIIAYTTIGGYRLRKCFVLLGAGANGKTTYLLLVNAFLGADSVAAIPLQELCENRFAAANLFGKLANICADIPSKRIEYAGTLKGLTGNDPIDAERKGIQERLRFVNSAKLLFSANELPESGDNSDGFYRRWILLSFPNIFTEKPELIDELTALEELSGLLNEILLLRKELLDSKAFASEKSSTLTRALWQVNSAPAAQFIAEFIDEDPEGWVETRTLVDAFNRFCKQKGVAVIPSEEQLIRLLKSSTRAVRQRESNGKRRWGYRNIQLKYQPPGKNGLENTLVPYVSGCSDSLDCGEPNNAPTNKDMGPVGTAGTDNSEEGEK